MPTGWPVFTAGETLKLCVVVDVFEMAEDHVHLKNRSSESSVTVEILMIGKKFGHTCIFTLLRRPLNKLRVLLLAILDVKSSLILTSKDLASLQQSDPSPCKLGRWRNISKHEGKK